MSNCDLLMGFLSEVIGNEEIDSTLKSVGLSKQEKQQMIEENDKRLIDNYRQHKKPKKKRKKKISVPDKEGM